MVAADLAENVPITDFRGAHAMRWQLVALIRAGRLDAVVARLGFAKSAVDGGVTEPLAAVQSALRAEESRVLPLADAALRRGEPSGRTLFEALAGLEPQQGYRLGNLGLCLRSLGDIAGAERAYQQAIRLGPDDAQIANDRGLLLRATGRPRLARIEFERSYALDSTVPGGKAGMGPAITNLLHFAALQAHGKADFSPDPLTRASAALAIRPDGKMLRRLTLDVALDRLDAPAARPDR